VSRSILAALGKFDPRLVAGMMALVVCLLAFEGWVLLLKGPQAAYLTQRAMRDALAASLAASPDQQGELARLAAELREAAARVTGRLGPPASDEQMVATVMSELDRSATRHGITLAGIRPGPRREVLSFEEASFDVNAQGDYLRLCAWLLEFEDTLGQGATVSELSMKSADGGQMIALALKVALYRPLRNAAAG